MAALLGDDRVALILRPGPANLRNVEWEIDE